MRALLGAAALLWAGCGASPASAGMADTPDCRRDLAMANQLIHAVRGRENKPQA